MYEYLRYPVLTPGRSPKDTCSFPVPHVYYFYAIVGANSTLLEELQRTAPEYVANMEHHFSPINMLLLFPCIVAIFVYYAATVRCVAAYHSH